MMAINSPLVTHQDLSGSPRSNAPNHRLRNDYVKPTDVSPLREIDSEKKKEKKWSIAKLFRRKKKDGDSGSSSESDNVTHCPSKRKVKKKKKPVTVNNFDHIVVSDSRRAFSLAKNSVCEANEESVQSDPACLNRHFESHARYHSSSPNNQIKNKFVSTKVLSSNAKKMRKGIIKARVEALRNSLIGDTSSDEDSLKSSNSSSIIRFRSDDSLLRPRDSSITKKTRSARNERCIKKLSREEEILLNKEAELLKQGYSKAEVEMLTRTPTSQSSGYGTCRKERNHNDHLRINYDSLNHSQPQYININAKVNNDVINYSFPHKLYKNSLSTNKSTNEYLSQKQQSEDVMCIKFPLGNINMMRKRESPPSPPPRDRQRKVITPLSIYHDKMKTDDQQNKTHGVLNNDFERVVRRSQERLTTGVRGMRRPISNSEDHIALKETDYVQKYRYKNEQPRRPASVSTEPNDFRFGIEHYSWQNSQSPIIIKPKPVATKHDHTFCMDQSPRSRKPINISSNHTGNNYHHINDLQTSVDNSSKTYRRPVTASQFWKKLDDAESKRNALNSNAENKFSNDVVIKKTPKNIIQYNSDSNIHDFRKKNHFNKNQNIELRFDPDTNKDWKATTEYKGFEPRSCDYPQLSISCNTDNYNNHLSSEEDKSERRKSTNLDDALNELEAIYNSLGLGDEDLLDRAERRELMTPKGNEYYSDWNGNETLQLSSQPSTPFQQRLRRSTTPDKIQDDMAFRKMQTNSMSKSKFQSNDTQSDMSYMLASPVYVPHSFEIDSKCLKNAPDIINDDVVYRNIKQTNNRLKTLDPQPPFGIPVGPVTPAPLSDYLHAVPEKKYRSRSVSRHSPDLVSDDLAYRSLRKDEKQSTMRKIENTNLINKPFDLKHTDKETSSRKKRAFRSLSANIFSIIQKEIDDVLNTDIKYTTTKNNDDNIKALLVDSLATSKDFVDKKVKDDMKIKKLTYSVSPTSSKANELFIDSNQNNLITAHQHKSSSTSSISPLKSEGSSKAEFQNVLSLLAQEAIDTSNKLGVALAEMEDNKIQSNNDGPGKFQIFTENNTNPSKYFLDNECNANLMNNIETLNNHAMKSSCSYKNSIKNDEENEVTYHKPPLLYPNDNNNCKHIKFNSLNPFLNSDRHELSSENTSQENISSIKKSFDSKLALQTPSFYQSNVAKFPFENSDRIFHCNNGKKKDNLDSTDYNSSEELAKIFQSETNTKFLNPNIVKSENENNNIRTDLSSPKLVQTMNQNLRRLSIDNTNNSPEQSSASINNIVPWRKQTRQYDHHDENRGEDSESKPNWHDPGTIVIACSYTLMLSHLAELDWLTLFGLLMAMITIFLMLII